MTGLCDLTGIGRGSGGRTMYSKPSSGHSGTWCITPDLSPPELRELGHGPVLCSKQEKMEKMEKFKK